MAVFETCHIKRCKSIRMNGAFCFEHAAWVRRMVTDGTIKPTTWDRQYEVDAS